MIIIFECVMFSGAKFINIDLIDSINQYIINQTIFESALFSKT